MRNQAFNEALNHFEGKRPPERQTDVRTGHITLRHDALDTFTTRTYTHMSPATGDALLRCLDCDLLTAPSSGQPYAVRFKGHEYETSIIRLTPNQVVPLPVPEPNEPVPDWANTLTDTLVEHTHTGTRFYFSHAPHPGAIAIFKGGRTSRTAFDVGDTMYERASHYRIVKED